MASLSKKKIIIINGPIFSGKNKIADLFAISHQNPKIVKISQGNLLKYQAIVKGKYYQDYEDFLIRECNKLLTEVEYYTDYRDTHDVMIIITDITALVEVLTVLPKAPQLSPQTTDILRLRKQKYLQNLRKNTFQIYITTTIRYPQILSKIIKDKKKDATSDYLSINDLQKHNDNWEIFHDHFLADYGFINNIKDNLITKNNDKITILGENIEFSIYQLGNVAYD